MRRAALKCLAAAAMWWGCCGACALAETVNETLESFGFFGSWAIDCDRPASPSNNHRSALVTLSGDAIFTESLGPDSEPNVYSILEARRSGDSIELRIKLNGETQQELRMRMDDGRLRTISTRSIADGKFLVRNGIVVSSGRKTPWLTRCKTL